jgi:hypothetical protein
MRLDWEIAVGSLYPVPVRRRPNGLGEAEARLVAADMLKQTVGKNKVEFADEGDARVTTNVIDPLDVRGDGLVKIHAGDVLGPDRGCDPVFREASQIEHPHLADIWECRLEFLPPPRTRPEAKDSPRIWVEKLVPNRLAD